MKKKNAGSLHEKNSIKTKELPEGWKLKKLKDTTKKVPSMKPDSEPERIFGYVDISSINNDTNQIVEFKKIRGEDAPSRARQSIQNNDILFSNVRTYLRNVAIVSDDLNVQVCSTGFTVLRSDGSILPKFLFYYTITNDFINEVTPQQTGSQYPATTDRVVKEATIPLPPLAEQQLIVTRVEALLMQVNGARYRLSLVPLIMKKFRQAVLSAACSGKLTEAWREEATDVENADQLIRRIDFDRKSIWRLAHKTSQSKKQYPEPQKIDIDNLPPLPNSWLWVTLDQIVQENRPIVYGIIKPGPDTPDSILYVRVNEMEDGKYIDISRLRRASKEIAAKYSRASLNDGDVLISKDGTIGRVALVPRELAGGNITQHTVRASIHPLINKFFIVRSIQSPISQQWLESEKKGVALQGVNIQDFRRLPVPLPPLSEQHEIVHRVNALFEHASAIEREVDMASRRCEGLTQAVLGKAFRGELSQTGMG